MITMAVHTVFIWVLAMTMQAKTVEQVPPQKPEIKQEQIIKQPAPVVPGQLEVPAPKPAPGI